MELAPSSPLTPPYPIIITITFIWMTTASTLEKLVNLARLMYLHSSSQICLLSLPALCQDIKCLVCLSTWTEAPHWPLDMPRKSTHPHHLTNLPNTTWTIHSQHAGYNHHALHHSTHLHMFLSSLENKYLPAINYNTPLQPTRILPRLNWMSLSKYTCPTNQHHLTTQCLFVQVWVFYIVAQEKWCCSCLAAIRIPVSCVVLIACF